MEQRAARLAAVLVACQDYDHMYLAPAGRVRPTTLLSHSRSDSNLPDSNTPRAKMPSPTMPASICENGLLTLENCRASYSSTIPNSVLASQPCDNDMDDQQQQTSPSRYQLPTFRKQSSQHEPQCDVQLISAMSTIRRSTDNKALFGGYLVCDHTWTAFHEYLASIHPQFGASFVDVESGSFHISLGTLFLPEHLKMEFIRAFEQAMACLPSLMEVEYRSLGLIYTCKPDFNTSQTHFYYLDLVNTKKWSLEPWLTALRKIAQYFGITYSRDSYAKHHVTLRRQAKSALPEETTQALKKAVAQNPILFKIASMRVMPHMTYD